MIIGKRIDFDLNVDVLGIKYRLPSQEDESVCRTWLMGISQQLWLKLEVLQNVSIGFCNLI